MIQIFEDSSNSEKKIKTLILIIYNIYYNCRPFVFFSDCRKQQIITVLEKVFLKFMQIDPSKIHVK